MHPWASDSALYAVERGIMGLLPVLGLACLVLFAWRWRRVGKSLAGMRERRAGLAEAMAFDGPATSASGSGSSAYGDDSAGRLVRVGLANAHLCPEALEKTLDAHIVQERHSLGRGAQFIGTVGANAPFLGLTGTVLGILSAFRRMAEQGGNGGTEVMAAIAGALVATAAGLLVAIPAVVLYNLLKARIRKALDGLAELRDLMLARSLQASAKEPF